MLYKIPVFNDVQYSCMKCCTLVCFALICRIKVWMYIILVGVLYLILMYTSIATLESVKRSPSGSAFDTGDGRTRRSYVRLACFARRGNRAMVAREGRLQVRLRRSRVQIALAISARASCPLLSADSVIFLSFSSSRSRGGRKQDHKSSKKSSSYLSSPAAAPAIT